MFTEARFGRGLDDRWHALHRAEAAALERFRSAGYEVTAVAREGNEPGDVGTHATTDVFLLPYYRGAAAFVRALPCLVPAIVAAVSEADRIVLHLPGLVGGLAATVCRLTGRRYSAEIKGDPAAVLASLLGGRRGRFLARISGLHMRWAVRGARRTVYVTREALQDLYPPARGSLSVGVSDLRLSPEQFVAAPRVRSADPARLVTVGHQDQHYKGHDVLLRAIALLRSEGLDVRGTIVGGGRCHEELRELRDALGLKPAVRMAGTVNDRHILTAILDDATIFVLPSLVEGLPRALVEALARGLPAVASCVGGIPELLDPSCLVPPGDVAALAARVREIVDDPDRLAATSRRNLDVARDYRADVLERRWRTWVDDLPTTS